LRRVFRATVVLASGLLVACTTNVPTDPQAFNIPSVSMSGLRASDQPVAVLNSYATQTKLPLRVGSSTWIVDLRDLTGTSAAMLTRALQQRGWTVVPQAKKSVTLRVAVQNATSTTIVAGISHARVRVTLWAEGADGTRTVVSGDGDSPASLQRAFDGAVLSALNRLLADEKFLAYMNR
jgi:hypothetical protein